MRVALQTWGSDGDIRPFIALGAGLHARGHQVSLAIASIDGKDYGPMCRDAGVACVRAPEHGTFDFTRFIVESRGAKNPIHVLRVLHEQALFPAWPAMGAAAARLCDEADVAVGHFMALPLRLAAERRGLPYASAHFWPGMIKDPARPAEGAPRLGRLLNLIGWRTAFALVDRAIGEPYRALYREAGLLPPKGYEALSASPRLNLVACSRALWPDAEPAPPHHFTGYWHAPRAASSLPAAVEEFFTQGEPAAFLTLGSFGQADPAGGEAFLLDVAERSGLRALIQLGEGRERPRASSRLAFIGKSDHAAIFPRCAAVLHHGGAGTAHAAAAAGKPAVVVSFMDEQRSWGRRLQANGACTGVFRYPFVKAAEVAEALRRAAHDDQVRARSAALGAALRAEDGVGEAVRLIEGLVAKPSSL